MDDLISRKAAIEGLWKALYEYEDKTEKQFIESEELDVADWNQHRIFVQNMSDIDRQTIRDLPSAQPETHEERTETHACDCISRQAAVDAVGSMLRRKFGIGGDLAEITLAGLPSAQPEIVRCGSCKYAEIADAQDNQDGYTCQFHRGSIWFSGSYCSWAERRTDDGE